MAVWRATDALHRNQDTRAPRYESNYPGGLLALFMTLAQPRSNFDFKTLDGVSLVD